MELRSSSVVFEPFHFGHLFFNEKYDNKGNVLTLDNLTLLTCIMHIFSYQSLRIKIFLK